MTDFNLTEIRGWVVDVDGCLVRTDRAGGRGGVPIDGAVEFLEGLRAAGHSVVVCTNASERTPAEYAAHLREMGLPVEDDAFVTAGSALAEHIATAHPGARVLVVGGDGVADPLRSLGVDLASSNDSQLPDVVVVSAAQSYDAADLGAAALAVEAGTPFYTSVFTPWFHGGNGRSLAASAAIAASIAWATGREPTVGGKPSKVLAESLLRQLGVPADRVAVVGDAPAEIDLARAAGARSITVLSGALTRADLDEFSSARQPDAVFADVKELHEARTSPHR